MHTSVAFPEIVVPLTMAMRKLIKQAKGGSSSSSGKMKEVGVCKTLVERVEESAKWMGEKRRNEVKFAPGRLDEVRTWERDVSVDETPLGKYVRVLRKTREKKQKMLQKVSFSSVLCRPIGWRLAHFISFCVTG